VAALKPETRTVLLKVGVAVLTNGLLKRGLRNQFLHGITPVARNMPPMAGPAFTLRFIPAREDIDTLATLARPDNPQRRALEACPPGGVLVIDTGNNTRSASAGDLMIGRLKARGCAGIVTDGGFRDIPGVIKVGLPAYQRRTSPPATPIGLHSVDFNAPIGCAGVAVYPADVVVGDSDGVVILPASLADELALEALETATYDEFAEQRIAAGRSIIEIFPPGADVLREYDEWKKSRGQ
jgi:regulator of RNase E activity RraA